MAQLIEWSDEYSVNVKIIDDQHKHFVGILNKLYENLQKGDAKVLPEILKELAEYKDYHFKTEEKYFDEFHYKFTKEHKEEHQKLREKVETFLNRKNEDPATLGFELLDFLEDWLVDHLANQDKKYTKCFNEHGLY